MMTAQISAAAEKLGLPIWANLLHFARKVKGQCSDINVSYIHDVSGADHEGLRTSLKWWGEKQFDSVLSSTLEASEE